ncbi:glycosyltransferase [Fulvivirga sediminis]|uniref:Rhamnosyl transferase n=1 Tax=Fulvivirga sediminis TaxID=2803949 RepID=A0A937K2W1_9BACT|nr:glycosyltransferase [Fulvivirga sediminis]MBL3659036.1 hypothetical protein [Fulvivirga sediminis]
MGIEFEHFLITRFNVKNQAWQVDKSGVTVRDDSWTKHRLQLFEQICLPSIQNQTNKNFKWLIYFDIDTCDEVRERFKVIRQENPFIFPRYIQGMEVFIASLQKDISSHLQKNTQHLITTRIDNDDAFHQEAMANIQSGFDGQKIEAINLLEGVQWEIRGDNFYYAFNESNPFISLIEKLNFNVVFKTVFYKDHRYFAEKPEDGVMTRQFCGEPMWLQVIHEANISNETDGQPIFKDGVLEMFSMNASSLKI